MYHNLWYIGAAQNELLELLELPFLKVVNVSVNLFFKAFFFYTVPNSVLHLGITSRRF